MKPDLSIVIVNWNTKDLLRECLYSIYKETKDIGFEIFLVDNASSDGSADMVGQKFPDVKLIRNKKNLGFGYANNQAARQCCGEYVLFLNPDTRIVHNVIVKLMNFMKENPRVGMTGPKCIHPDGSIQVSWAHFPSLWTIFTNNVPWKMAISVFDIFGRLFKTNAVYSNEGYTVGEAIGTQKVDYILGQFMLTRKEVLDKVGLFDEDIFMYEEEADLCYRIYQGGWETWFMADAEIIHYERKSIDQLSRTMEREIDWFLVSRAHFFKKHYGKLNKILFHIVTFGSSFIKLNLFAVAFLLDSRKRNYLKGRVKYHWFIEKWYVKRLFS